MVYKRMEIGKRCMKNKKEKDYPFLFRYFLGDTPQSFFK